MKYKVLEITNGVTTILQETEDKKEAKEAYTKSDRLRLMVDGEMLLIHEAEKLMRNGRKFVRWSK